MGFRLAIGAKWPMIAADEVTTPERDREPPYTTDAREREIEGQLVLRINIDERGRISDVKLVKGLGYGLDEAAIAFSIMVGMFWPFALAWSIYLSIVLNLEGLPLSKGMRRSGLLVSYRFGRAQGFVLTTSVMAPVRPGIRLQAPHGNPA